MLEGIHKIHLIGIGGIGMRAIANVLILQGFDVSGSDVKESVVVNHFREMGARIFIGHDAKAVEGVDAIVISTAIPEDNPELVAAREQGITVLHRSDVVKAVVDITKGIAVAGAHGKTTTTSMLGQIFEEALLDPTIIIGGEVNYLQGNSKLGKGEHSIVEADESDGSFLKLNPRRIVVTNIENDHMDHYKTMENLLKAFDEFIHKLPKEDGLAIVCGDNINIRKLLPALDRRVITYGFNEDNDYVAKDVHYEDHLLVYDIYKNGFYDGRIKLQVPGLHNVLNSLGAYALAQQEGIETEVIAKALIKFIGAKRRFETKGLVNGIWIVDDYAHHPTEINATLKAAKDIEKHRVVCVFQPHRYTRTNLLLKEFSQAFKEADVIVMTDIYGAGEAPIAGIDGYSIPKAIKEATGQEVHYVANADDLPAYLMTFIKPQDLVITMGAGNINQYGLQLVALLEERGFAHEG